MKKEILISVGFVALGFFLECLHFMTEIQFFEIKLWLLGSISIIIGVAGLVWFGVIPLLEHRAEMLGKFKKRSLKRNSKS